MKMEVNSIKAAYEKRMGMMPQDEQYRLLSMALMQSIPYLVGQIEVFHALTGGWRPIETWHQPEREQALLIWGWLGSYDREKEKPLCYEAFWTGGKFLAANSNDELIASHWMLLPKGPDGRQTE